MEVFNFINERSHNSLESIRTELFQLYIKSGYDKTGRLILYPGNRGANIIGKLNDLCNGMVLYSPSFANSEEKFDLKVLACPTPYLRKFDQVSPKTVLNSWTSDTVIYQSRHGTNITVYWFQDAWRISTCKGIDMNEVKWTDKTYQQMIDDCLSVYETTWLNFTDQLNKNYSYAMQFYHPSCHAFRSESHPDIWIHNIIDHNNFADVTNEVAADMPIKVMQPMSFPAMSKADIVNYMRGECGKAFKRHMDALNEGKVDNADTNLGYIIRNLKGGDILYESTLLTAINSLYYDIKYTNMIQKTDYERHNFVLLYNYLGANYQTFMTLFPHFTHEFDRFTALFDALFVALNNLYQLDRQKNNPSDKPAETILSKSAAAIKKNNDEVAELNVDDKGFDARLLDLVYAPFNFDALYHYIYNE
jgi:hypothetical protein